MRTIKRRIGAANTVTTRAGDPVGCNTGLNYPNNEQEWYVP